MSIISAGTSNTTSLVYTGDTTGAMVFQTNGTTEAMRIDTNGNVGIGTTSPIAKLDVRGSGAYFYDNSTTDFQLTVGSSISTIGTTTATPLAFKTNVTERMRISSAGTLFIGGTTSPSGTQRLVLTANGGAGIEPMLFNELRSTSATENYVQFYRNGSQVGSITNTLSATAYLTSSDYRLKENIAPMTGALAKVAQLKPVTYKWKATGEDGQGFIAHELQALVPDCVSGEKDAVDKDGKPKYQGIDTSFLVATLTAAIQELNAKVDAQAAEIAALKGNN